MSDENSNLRQLVEALKNDLDNHKKDTERRLSVLENIVEKLKEAIGKLEKTALELTIAITGLKESLGEIKGDTKWLRRTITASLIGFGIGALIAAIKFVPIK